MTRKSAMISESTRVGLDSLKSSLKAKNDDETIQFLLAMFEDANMLPKGVLLKWFNR